MKYYKCEINFFWRDDENYQWCVTANYYIKSSKKLRKNDLYRFGADDIIENITEIEARKAAFGEISFDDSQVYLFEEISEEEYKKAETDPERNIFKFDEDVLIDKEKCEEYLGIYKNRKNVKSYEVTEEESNKFVKILVSSIYDYFNMECVEGELIPFFAFDKVEFKKGTERLLLVQSENETRKDVQKRIQKVLEENILDENIKYKINSISGKYNYDLTLSTDAALAHGFVFIQSNKFIVYEIKKEETVEKKIDISNLGIYCNELFDKLDNLEIEIAENVSQIKQGDLVKKSENIKRIYIIELYY